MNVNIKKIDIRDVKILYKWVNTKDSLANKIVTKYPKGKFKGLSIDAFSKVSAGSKYDKGKRSTNK